MQRSKLKAKYDLKISVFVRLTLYAYLEQTLEIKTFMTSSLINIGENA